MIVSIITVSLNSELNIKTCIESVLSQNYCDIEYIIIDGNSSDNTLSTIKEYQQSYSFIKLISEDDKGIYDALNKGINLASGDVIGFVHSDDFLDSNCIISDIVSIMKSKGADGVYGDLQYVKRNYTSKIIRTWKSRSFYPEMIKKAWMPPHPTLFLRKEVFEKHGYFDTSYNISADYEFILRIFKDQFLKFEYLPKVITTMRLGGISNRSLKNILNKTLEDYRAMKKHQVGNIITLARKTFSKLDQYFKR